MALWPLQENRITIVDGFLELGPLRTLKSCGVETAFAHVVSLLNSSLVAALLDGVFVEVGAEEVGRVELGLNVKVV